MVRVVDDMLYAKREMVAQEGVASSLFYSNVGTCAGERLVSNKCYCNRETRERTDLVKPTSAT